MSSQGFMECIQYGTGDQTAVSNTVTETTLISDGITMPAFYESRERRLKLHAKGKHSTLGSGTVTATFRLRWGTVGSGTLICATAAITQVISLTNAFWDLDLDLQLRSSGATGTISGNGVVRMFGATAPTIGSATGAPAIAPMTAGGQTAPTTATISTVADTPLSLSVQLGAASASNTITTVDYALWSLN